MTPRAILEGIRKELGPVAWGDFSAYWVTNVAADRFAAEAALLALQKRRAQTRTMPVKNPNGWLTTVYRANEGKVVAPC